MLTASQALSDHPVATWRPSTGIGTLTVGSTPGDLRRPGFRPAGAPPADWVLRALQASKHVVVEEPFCLPVDEADRQIAAADAAGLSLAVYQNRRWESASGGGAPVVPSL